MNVWKMCVTPYITTNKEGKVVAVPCGHCLQCLKDFQTGWTFRLTQECKRTIMPLFVTLTYNDEHLPVDYNEDGVLQSVLKKSDFQNFMKRFRRYNPKLSKDCRYFAVGEYGAKKNRCHFHLVLILPALRWDDYKKRRILLHYMLKRCEHAWSLAGQQIGFVKVEHCQEKQIRYVTKYMNKIDKRPHIVKPFRLMSKSIGLNFLTDQMVDYYLSTFDRTILNGRARINMPKYYKQKLDEFSHRHWMLKRAGLTYSQLLPEPQYKGDSLRDVVRRAQKDFCDNFADYYRQCVAHISHLSRRYGYQMYEPNRNEVYGFVVSSNHALQDAIRISNETIDACCIKNGLLIEGAITRPECEFSS